MTNSPVRSFAQLFFLIAFATPLFAQTPVWSDEFDGDTLDYDTWTFDVGGTGFGNQELQFYSARPDNVYLDDGALVIQALRESYEGKEFTSSRLKTHGRLEFRYGTLEARIQVPDLADGLWPAFWLLGRNLNQNTWPACGELDILEMGNQEAIAAGIVNHRVYAGAHWDYQGSYAGYGLSYDRPSPMHLDYHTYKLDWTPDTLTVSFDNTPYWTMDISDPASASLEEFHEPMFIIMNLAVGGNNFVNITDPAGITAPFPAQMNIDWIRLYDNGYTELYFAEDSAETGNFGVFTETTPVEDEVTYGTNAELYIWNNMVTAPTAPYEGNTAWSFNVSPGNWWGMGVYCLENRNMMNYSDGDLHFHMKTTSSQTIGVGIASAAAGDGWIDLVDGGEEFGLVRDGNWHEVVIPLNRFGNVDFNTIVQLFMLVGDAPASAFNVGIDNIYWTPSADRPTPENGAFGVFTDNPAHLDAGQFILGADGEFFVWDNTLDALAGDPYEGENSIALASAAGQTWFGAAFTPNIKYNLTAYRYPESVLHFALKTSSATTFSIGMKSGTVDYIGQHWIEFEAGNDPYGFARDGEWHVIEIPMSEFAAAVDLSAVSQFFELLGTEGAISNIEIDDVCFLNGGAAIDPNGQDPGDLDGDGDVDLADLQILLSNYGQSGQSYTDGDLTGDGVITLADLQELLSLYGTTY